MCFSIFLPIDFQSGTSNKATPCLLVLPLAQKAIAGPDGLTAAKGVCRGVPYVWGSSASPGLCEGTGGLQTAPRVFQQVGQILHPSQVSCPSEKLHRWGSGPLRPE